MLSVAFNGETWLICGGRNFEDEIMFDDAMQRIVTLRGFPSKIVQGGASGADFLAKQWAKRMAIECAEEKAQWTRHRKAAGILRNAEMLIKHRPQVVIAFPGGSGTADMVQRSRKAGVEVIEVELKDG